MQSETARRCISQEEHGQLCLISGVATFTVILVMCVPLPILSLSGVDRHDCLSPSFSVLCQLSVELVLFEVAPHSVYPPQSGPSSRSLPSHLHCCYLPCNVRLFSSHHMAIPRFCQFSYVLSVSVTIAQ